MEFGIEQQQILKPAITKDLRQAISILQYSNQELAQFIRGQALENPLIDLQEQDDNNDDAEPYHSELRKNKEYNPFDFIENKKDGLKEDLLQQARCLKLAESTYRPIAYMILLLDDDGYLSKKAVSETAEKFKLTEREAERVLSVLQKLEPPGVGARSLRECLLLQIDRFDPRNRIAREIVTDHLFLLAKRDWQAIASALSTSVEAVQHEAYWIKTLHPRPGSVFDYNTEKQPFLKPDLTLKREEDRFVIILHDGFLPTIRMNREYGALLTGDARNETTKYLKNKYKKMTWLMKCIEQRRKTLLKVTEIIVQKQQSFLEHGFQRLMPMTLKEVADELKIHESTVSRTIRNKNIQTPFGLYEMQSFFTSKVQKVGGEMTSSASVKMKIKELIGKENKDQPLSDQKITKELRTIHGVVISRRTVAKYREQLGISSSAKRKRRLLMKK